MLDDPLREQLAAWVHPVTSQPIPDIRVLRRRARRRGIRKAVTAAAKPGTGFGPSQLSELAT